MIPWLYLKLSEGKVFDETVDHKNVFATLLKKVTRYS